MSDRRRDAVLVVTTEVDHAVLALVAAAAVAGGHAAVVVTATGLVQRAQQRLSGVSRVISTKSETDEKRRPGVVGLYLRIPIVQMSLRSQA